MCFNLLAYFSQNISVKKFIFVAYFRFKNKNLYFYRYNNTAYARSALLLKNFTFR